MGNEYVQVPQPTLSTDRSLGNRQPQTMQHTFTHPILNSHFIKTPPPNGSCLLIDLPGDVFLDTEEDSNVIGATLWIMTVEYDKMAEKERPKNREELRKASVFQCSRRYRTRSLDRLLPELELTAFSGSSITATLPCLGCCRRSNRHSVSVLLHLCNDADRIEISGRWIRCNVILAG